MDGRTESSDDLISLTNPTKPVKRHYSLAEKNRQAHLSTRNSWQEFSCEYVMTNASEQEESKIAIGNNNLLSKTSLRRDSHLLSALDEVDELLSNFGF